MSFEKIQSDELAPMSEEPVSEEAILARAVQDHAEAMSKIRIRIAHGSNGMIRVKAPYNKAFLAKVVPIPGQRWVESEKVREVPEARKGELLQALRAAYKGQEAIGPKGVFVV